MASFPAYLTDALTRFADECRAEGHALAQAELRGQMASLLGLAAPRGDATPPKSHITGEESPKTSYPYGTIAKVVRDVMLSSPRNGLLITDILTRAEKDYHTPMTAGMARNALRRMKLTDDVVCRNRSRWTATDKLRGANDANENGALNGRTVGAPPAGEGATLHQSRQSTLGLAG